MSRIHRLSATNRFLTLLLPTGLLTAFTAPALSQEDGSENRPAKTATETKGAKKKSKGDGLPVSKKSDEKLLKFAGENGKIHHTGHYAIGYDTEDPTLRAFVHRVEATYKAVTRFVEKVGVEVEPPKEKLQILFFEEYESYSTYRLLTTGSKGDESTPGFFSPTDNRSAFFNYANASHLKSLEREIAMVRAEMQGAAKFGARFDTRRLQALEGNLAREKERTNRMVVQHEVAHQVLFNLGLHATVGERDPNPRWFVEGLAMMFETPPGQGGAGLGAVNQNRLGDWLELEKSGQLIPLRQLVSDPRVIIPPAPTAGAAYAQAWSLVHYLQRNKGKQLASYIDAIRKRTDKKTYNADDEIKAFEEAFGPLDSKFEEKYKAAVKRLPFKPE